MKNIFLSFFSICICCSACFAYQASQTTAAVQASGEGIGFYVFSVIAVLSIIGLAVIGATKYRELFPQNLNSYTEKIRDAIRRSRGRLSRNKVSIQSILDREEFNIADGDKVRHTGLLDLADTASNYRGILDKFRLSKLRALEVSSVPPVMRVEPLKLCFDEELMLAIPLAEDTVEDIEVRKLAIRIMAKFRSSNSIYVLSRLALFDAELELRNLALSSLAGFDHISVFEPILMCCSSANGEVRTTARAALFKLGIDRTSAWVAIANSGDKIRVGRCARAAVLAGFAAKAFEWSISSSVSEVNEATAIVSLLLCSTESKLVFEAIRRHRDINIKMALIHLVGVSGEGRVLPELKRLLDEVRFPIEVLRRIDSAILRLSPRELNKSFAAAA